MFDVLGRLKRTIWNGLVHWLTFEAPNGQNKLTKFDRLRYEVRPGDVLLVEGRSHVASIIKMITQSIWTHSALYLGRIHDIEDHELRERIRSFGDFADDDQLIIESLLGAGTIVDKLDKYADEHLRICRPTGITHQDTQRVMGFAISQLGADYNVRHLLDLARFMFPYHLLPRRWRSGLFEHNAGIPTKTICSTMMAEAFASVHFPIHPILQQDADGQLKVFQRNSKLITPPDFDYSPYFEVVKYPLLDFDELAVYRRLPWDRSGVHCNAIGDCFTDAPDLVEVARPEGEKEDSKEGSSIPGGLLHHRGGAA